MDVCLRLPPGDEADELELASALSGVVEVRVRVALDSALGADLTAEGEDDRESTRLGATAS